VASGLSRKIWREMKARVFVTLKKSVFDPQGKNTPPPDDTKAAELYEQIGRLQVELAFVKKKSPGLG